MPIKKQIKKTATKAPVQRKRTNVKKTPLKTWLFDKPAMFSIITLGATVLITFLYAIFAAIFNITSSDALAALLIITFGWTTYYLIKKLPHGDMSRDDFVAITNGCNLICLFILLLAVLFTDSNIIVLQHKIMWLYVFHPVILWIIGIFTALFNLYLFGVVIANIYAKYKRAVQLGISKWQVIASMPFAFLLMWTPGYLISDKKHETNLEIKCKWYRAFNNWVVNNAVNALVTFLAFVLLMNLFSGALSLLLTGFLLVLYALWNLRYKTKFITNIKKGYTWTAIAINLSVWLVVILRAIAG
jgi:hypothetical protein